MRTSAIGPSAHATDSCDPHGMPHARPQSMPCTLRRSLYPQAPSASAPSLGLCGHRAAARCCRRTAQGCSRCSSRSPATPQSRTRSLACCGGQSPQRPRWVITHPGTGCHFPTFCNPPGKSSPSPCCVCAAHEPARSEHDAWGQVRHPAGEKR